MKTTKFKNLIMAYIRGKYYSYRDADGQFFMFGNDYVPQSIVDEFVVMRYAQLIKEKRAKEVEFRSIKKYTGNFGCDALCEKHGKSTTTELLKVIQKFNKKKNGRTRKNSKRQNNSNS